jgi:hypothetical protein
MPTAQPLCGPGITLPALVKVPISDIRPHLQAQQRAIRRLPHLKHQSAFPAAYPQCPTPPQRAAGAHQGPGRFAYVVGLCSALTEHPRDTAYADPSRPPNRTNQFKTPVRSRVNGSYFTPQDTSSNSFPGQWFRFHTPGDQFSQKTV